MKCYLCGREDLVLLTDRLRNCPGTVLHCPDCDLGLLESVPADLQRYYDEEYRKEYGPKLGQCSGYDEIFAAHVQYQQHRIDLLKPYLGPEVRLLEVGCSTGHFLYHVREHVGEAVGVDFDSGATEFAAKKCELHTYGGALEDSGFEKGSFDIVCAYQTLEHVPDPIAFMRSLSEYLKPGGIMCIEVPNLHDPLISVYANEAYRPFYYHEAHLYYFGEKALLEVMQRAGMTGDVHYIQDYNLGNHMHWTHVNGPQPTCHTGLGSPKLPLSDSLPKEAAEELQAWYAEADKAYKALLARHGLTDNMTFIGRKTE